MSHYLPATGTCLALFITVITIVGMSAPRTVSRDDVLIKTEPVTKQLNEALAQDSFLDYLKYLDNNEYQVTPEQRSIQWYLNNFSKSGDKI